MRDLLCVSLVCLAVGTVAFSSPLAAEQASEAEVLALLDASLAAGEGAAATKLLEKYLERYPRTARVIELQALTAFYSGDYDAANGFVDELRTTSAKSLELGQMADLITQTHETLRDYETQRHGHFEVRYSPGVDELLVPYAIDTLKAVEKAMEEELGATMVGPVRLEIYPDADSLAKVSTLSVAAIRKTGTIALCKWGRLMIASPRALLRGYPWLDTIAHEYVHLIITKATLDRAPVWFQEGTAKFMETRWRNALPKLRHDPASARVLYEAATTGELLPFERLHPSIALLPTQRDAALAFAQVSSFMERFYREHGRAGLQEALEHIADGIDAREALEKVSDRSWKELEKSWQIELSKLPKPPSVRMLPRHLADEANENDELATVERERARKYARLGDLLWSRSRPAAASVEYAKAHKAAPLDPVVASRYARSAIAGGRPEDAIKPLSQTLRFYPTHAPSHSNLATALFQSGRKDQAIGAAQRAIAHNPFDPQPHCILGQTAVPHSTHEREVCSRLGGMTP